MIFSFDFFSNILSKQIEFHMGLWSVNQLSYTCDFNVALICVSLVLSYKFEKHQSIWFPLSWVGVFLNDGTTPSLFFMKTKRFSFLLKSILKSPTIIKFLLFSWSSLMIPAFWRKLDNSSRACWSFILLCLYKKHR